LRKRPAPPISQSKDDREKGLGDQEDQKLLSNIGPPGAEGESADVTKAGSQSEKIPRRKFDSMEEATYDANTISKAKGQRPSPSPAPQGPPHFDTSTGTVCPP
jgi:hypothetical protein